MSEEITSSFSQEVVEKKKICRTNKCDYITKSGDVGGKPCRKGRDKCYNHRPEILTKKNQYQKEKKDHFYLLKNLRRLIEHFCKKIDEAKPCEWSEDKVITQKVIAQKSFFFLDECFRDIPPEQHILIKDIINNIDLTVKSNFNPYCSLLSCIKKKAEVSSLA